MGVVVTSLLRIALGLMVAVTLAGCGSDGTGGTVSRVEFIRQADVICANMNRDLHAIEAKQSVPPLEYYRRSSDIASNAADKLGALDRPAQGATEVDKWLAAFDRWVALRARLEQAERQNGQDIAMDDQLFLLNERLLNTMWRRARDYGLLDCSK